MPNIFRIKETNDKYREHLEKIDRDSFTFNPDGPEVIKKWKYWFLRPDDFPYDDIATVHHLIFPIRTFGQIDDANEKELEELKEIKKEISPDYDLFMEKPYDSARSVKMHAHIHALKLKEK